MRDGRAATELFADRALVKRCIEPSIWIVAFGRSVIDIVNQRIDAGPRYIRVLAKIPTRIEDRIGKAAFSPSMVRVVLERIDLTRNIRVLRPVPTRIEVAGCRQGAEQFVPRPPFP